MAQELDSMQQATTSQTTTTTTLVTQATQVVWYSPSPQSRFQQAACKPGVLLPSVTAWRVLLGGPLLLWLLSTTIGIMMFRGIPSRKSEVEHFMQGFDALFRAGGPLLPLLPWLLRLLALDLPVHLQVLARSLRGPRGHAVPAAKCTLPWSSLLAYAAIALVRVLLYVAHNAAQRRHAAAHSFSLIGGAGSAGSSAAGAEMSASASMLEPSFLRPEHTGAWVSDHVFLAASVLACLQLELVCSVSDVVKLEAVGSGMLREFIAAIAMFATAALAACVCIDMYFTCRYYHYPAESAMGVVAGTLLFHVPLFVWLRYKCKSQEEEQGAPQGVQKGGDDGSTLVLRSHVSTRTVTSE